MLIGGGRNHRMGLFDMIMIKDNHISIAGGVINALRAADMYLKEKGLEVPVEVMLILLPLHFFYQAVVSPQCMWMFCLISYLKISSINF